MKTLHRTQSFSKTSISIRLHLHISTSRRPEEQQWFRWRFISFVLLSIGFLRGRPPSRDGKLVTSEPNPQTPTPKKPKSLHPKMSGKSSRCWSHGRAGHPRAGALHDGVRRQSASALGWHRSTICGFRGLGLGM